MSIDQRPRGLETGRPVDPSLDDSPPERLRERKLELSLPQILAGALAAASAAVASSWLGVAGTVLGAAVVSIIASVASSLYTHQIERSSQVLRETLPVRPLRPRLADEAVGTTVAPTATLFDLPPVEVQAEAHPAEPVSAPSERRRIHWASVAVTSIVTLVAGFGLLTAFEAVLGKPASSLTGSDSDGGTTVIRIIERDSSDQTETEEPVSDEPSEPTEPTGSEPTVTEPTVTKPAPTQPTEPAPTEPTSPSATQTAPTGQQPTQTAPTTGDASLP